jgi:uncharacterized protein YecT (DUF1311 family)
MTFARQLCLVLLAAIGLVSMPMAPLHADDKCLLLKPDSALRDCLQNELAASEAGLKAALVNAANFALDHASLAHSQAAWLQYRDSECAFEGSATPGGTLEVTNALLCEIAKNNSRSGELRTDAGLNAH